MTRSHLRHVYDAAGQVTSSTDVNGKVTTYTYDDDGNVVSSVDFAGRTTAVTYVDGYPRDHHGRGGGDDHHDI